MFGHEQGRKFAAIIASILRIKASRVYDPNDVDCKAIGFGEMAYYSWLFLSATGRSQPAPDFGQKTIASLRE